MFDSLLAVSLAMLLTGTALSCLALTVLGLPGNWLMVGAAALAWWAISPESIAWLPKWSIGVLFALALVGEAIEFAAGALGVGKLGGSKRAAALAVVGSLVGALAGMFVGLPIPIVGSVIASILLGGVGACAGAALGERWVGKDWDGSVRVGVAAFWGKLLGTLGKAICGATMAGILVFLAWV